MRFSRYACLVFAGVLVTPAVAQETEIVQDNLPREEMVTTALRIEKPVSAIPNMVTLIDESTIQEQLVIASDISTLLGNLVPGFAPSRQKLTGFGETFRGRSPLYLIDGVPQSNPLRDGSRDGYTIDLAVVERIEVIHGANAIQGLGATGGIINYVTRQPNRSGEWEHGLTLALTAADNFDSDGFEYRGSYYATKRFGQFDFVAAASYHKRDLFFDAKGRPIGVDSTQGDLADSEERNFFLKLGFEPAEGHRLQVMVNDYRIAGDGDYSSLDGDRALGIPTTAIEGAPPGEPALNDVINVSVDYSYDDLFGGTLAAQFYIQDFRAIFGGGTFAIFQDPAIAPVGTLFDQSENNSEKVGGRLTWATTNLANTDIVFITGVDVLRDKTFQSLIQTDRNWVPQTTFENVAPFVQLDVPIGEMITLSGGLRYETVTLKVPDYETIAGNRRRSDFLPTPVIGGSPSFDDVLLNGGIVVEPWEMLSLYASYSQGFTMPDVGRVLRGVNVPGQRVDDFLAISPLVADNIEFGFTVTLDWLRFQASYFQSRSKFGVRLVADADGVLRVNREKTRIRGFEATLEAQVNDNITAGANLSILNGRVDTNDDGVLDADLDGVNIGPDRLNLYLAGEYGNFTGRIQAAILFDRNFDDAAGSLTAEFNGYTVVDLYAGYRFSFGTVQLGIQNLLDENYITYYSQVGTTRNDRFFAGRGRTFTLAYQVTF